MTQTLARVVYQLDLENLPLDQLKKDNHRSHHPSRPRTNTSAANHKDWKAAKRAFDDFKPKPPVAATTARTPLSPGKHKSYPALRSVGKTVVSVDDSRSPQMLLQQSKDDEPRRQSTPARPVQDCEPSSPRDLQTMETSLLEVQDETRVARNSSPRTSSPRKHRGGYKKLELPISDPPSDESVIENLHILSPTLETEKLAKAALLNDWQQSSNNQVVSGNMGMVADSITLQVEERPGSRTEEKEHESDLVISNDAVTGVEDAHSSDQSPSGAKGNDDGVHSKSLVNVEPASKSNPLRRSRSENNSLYRLAHEDVQRDFRQRSRSPDISGRANRTSGVGRVSVSSKLSPLDTFSGFVPEVKSNSSSSNTGGGQLTMPSNSTPVAKPSKLSKAHNTPSTIYEKGKTYPLMVDTVCCNSYLTHF